MKKFIKEHKDYLIQTMPVLMGYIAGIYFFFFPPWGYIIGSIMFFYAITSSAYFLKKFDLRPDVTQAREDIKSMQSEYKKYVKEIEGLRTEYSDMKSKIGEAKSTLITLRMNLDHVSHELVKISSQLQDVDKTAKVANTVSWVNSLVHIIDKFKK